MLALDDVHTMYWETSGNPAGAPVLFVHGGPGAGVRLSIGVFSIPNSFASCFSTSAARGLRRRSVKHSGTLRFS